MNSLSESVPQPWAEWWRAVADNADIEHRFAARNLLLDEKIEIWRAESYANCLASTREPLWPADQLSHNFTPHKKYVIEQLWKAHSGVLPDEIEMTDWSCPETFRQISDSSPFLDANLDLRLVRVESMVAMAARIGISERDLLDAATATLSGATAAARDLDVYFETLADKSRVRPEFATFLADVVDAFALPDWPERLRDLLGLFHYNPSIGSEIAVLAFSYPIRDVPCLRGQPKHRPLVPPIVLESNWSAAFCPSPAGGRTGHTIDLSGTALVPRREVVHPTMRYRPNHLFRIGTIRTQVESDTLEVARSLHLTEIRELCARSDYASDTDSDIV